MKTQITKVNLKGRASRVCPLHIFVHFSASHLEKITLQEGRSLALFFPERHAQENSLIEWFKAFFEGEELTFPLPLNQGNIPPFSWHVLKELQNIPRGKTCSYSDVAANVGNEKAARAVGNACRVNPFPIVVPCHRVVRENGTLGGFAYGSKIKENLLNIERLETL